MMKDGVGVGVGGKVRSPGQVTGAPPAGQPEAEAGCPVGAVGMHAVDAPGVQAVMEHLVGVGPGLDDVGRIDLLNRLEALKGAAEAAQARVSVDLAESIESTRAAEGVPANQRGAGIGAQIALARGESPWHGSRHLGMAKALVHEMPHTLAALQAGTITGWTATVLVRATACLSVEHRGLVDARVADQLGSVSIRRLEAVTRSYAYELDPHAVTARARRAVSERRVTVRPAPDTMAYLTALLPVGEAVGCLAALTRAAEAALATGGEERTRGQLMADELVSRVTGVDPASEGLPVEIHLVMGEDTLSDGDVATPGRIPGFGPVPAPVARLLARTGSTRPEDTRVSPATRAWVRRLFTRTDGTVAGRDTRRRFFDTATRGLLIARDQTCRTPWCDAPIRHADHVTRQADGGPTETSNGAGLCEACNYTKDIPGWHAEPQVDDLGTQHIRLTTPTGHTYTSTPPPALDRLDPTRDDWADTG